jgi:hypothetical protein
MTAFLQTSGIQRLVYFAGVAKILLDSDRNTRQVFNGAGTQTLNIVLDSVIPMPPDGVRVEVVREGAGNVVIQAAAGVTLNGVVGGSETITTQYEYGLLINRGLDNWLFVKSGGSTPATSGLIGSPITVSLNAAATTSIYTLGALEKAIASRVEIFCSAASGVTIPPSFSVGFGSGVDEIIFPQTAVGFFAANQIWSYPIGGDYMAAIGGQTISFKVVSPSDAPMTGIVSLFGRLI